LKRNRGGTDMPITIDDKILYTLPEIREKTGLGLTTLRMYVRTGILQAVKVGVKYLVDEKELKRIFTEGTHKLRNPRRRLLKK